MSERLQEEMAVHIFREFAVRLSACQPAPVEIGDADQFATMPVDVSKEEMLRAFLAIHPKYERFRSKMLVPFTEQPGFCLHPERWAKVRWSAR